MKTASKSCKSIKKFLTILSLCFIASAVSAQTDTSSAALSFTALKDTSAAKTAQAIPAAQSACKLGDQAPPLRVKEWIKGTPVTSFEKGKIYVIDFWATWCHGCITSMPHLSKLADRYKGQVTFSAVSVFEDRGTRGATLEKLKTFVDGMGRKMNFSVAAEDTAFTVHDWLRDFYSEYIPISYVIDKDNRIVWYGSPLSLDTVLKKVINNTWDIDQELARRAYVDSHVTYLTRLDTSVISKVRRFQPTYSGRNYLGFPDSTLMVIDEMVKNEPKLKYAPWVAEYTFTALLLKDPHKAYEYGQQAMVTSSYTGPAYESIIADIQTDAIKLTPPKEIYLLGAACYQAKIDNSTNLGEYDLGKYYHEMADWYYKGGDKEKAIAAEKKVIKYWEKQLKDQSK